MASCADRDPRRIPAPWSSTHRLDRGLSDAGARASRDGAHVAGRRTAQVPAAPPDSPESFDAILADLETVVVPGLSHWTHPKFFGYFPCNGDLSSVLGDLASSGLGVLGLAWQSSPALTEIEEAATDWLRQMLGLSGAWSGVIQDTASTSTLVALLCARERATNYSLARGGLQARAGAAHRLYVRAQPQLGRKGRVARRHRPRQRAPDRARRRVGHAAGCARAGHPGRPRRRAAALRRGGDDGNHDEYGDRSNRGVAAVARRHGLWLHVDAAMAGSAMILPECRWMWEGVEERRFRRRQSAQMARRHVRLLGVLRAAARGARAGDVHESRAISRPRRTRSSGTTGTGDCRSAAAFGRSNCGS